MAKKRRKSHKNPSTGNETPAVVDDDAPPSEPCACCSSDGSAATDDEGDDDWDLASGGARPHYLFKVSGFVLIVGGILFAFGGWYVSQLIPVSPNPQLLEWHCNLVLGSLLYGVLLIIGGILLKLYAVLLVCNHVEEQRGLPPIPNEWFLKMSSLLFTMTAGAILIRGYLSTEMIDYAAASSRNVVEWFALQYMRRCILSGTFFLLLGAFALLYLVASKVARGTPFEESD